MSSVSKPFKLILLLACLLSGFILAYAQVRSKGKVAANTKRMSLLLSEFKNTAAHANVVFTPPKGFREIRPVDNENFTFDYAMDLPGRGFEVWYKVRSQKENYASYERTLDDESLKLENPDSIYIEKGRAYATAFTGERDLFIKKLPPNVLKRYRANAGRSYLLNLLDMPETKHYRYGLLLSLQKFHTGNILMVCFTNHKGPEFYKNVERACNSLKFKSSANIVNKLAD